MWILSRALAAWSDTTEAPSVNFSQSSVRYRGSPERQTPDGVRHDRPTASRVYIASMRTDAARTTLGGGSRDGTDARHDLSAPGHGEHDTHRG